MRLTGSTFENIHTEVFCITKVINVSSTSQKVLEMCTKQEQSQWATKHCLLIKSSMLFIQ